MKTKILFFLLFISLNTLKSQGFYIGAFGGYGFGIAKANETSTVNNGYYSTIQSKPYSLGQGVHSGVYGGYYLTKNLGFEVRASYLRGSTSLSIYDYTRIAFDDHFIYEFRKQGNMFRVIPSIRMGFGERKISAYMLTGFIIGTGVKLTETQTYVNDGSYDPGTHFVQWEYTGNLSFGFYSATGIEYKIGGKFKLFCEITAYLQNWAMKKGEMTSAIIHGIETIDQAPVAHTQTEYYDTYERYDTYDPNKPIRLAKEYKPFSSVGITFGIQFNFFKSKTIN